MRVLGRCIYVTADIALWFSELYWSIKLNSDGFQNSDNSNCNMSSEYLLLAESKMTVLARITRAKNNIIANTKSQLVIIIYRVHRLFPTNKRVLETAPVNEFKRLLLIDNRRGLTPAGKAWGTWTRVSWGTWTRLSGIHSTFVHLRFQCSLRRSDWDTRSCNPIVHVILFLHPTVIISRS